MTASVRWSSWSKSGWDSPLQMFPTVPPLGSVPLSIRPHGGLPLLYLFVLSGQTHGLYYSVDLLFWSLEGEGEVT